MDSDERRDGLRDRICANPDAWWRILQELIAEAPDDRVLGSVAAGELEEFVLAHAADFIDRIEDEARANPRFKSALSYLYLWRLSPESFARIEAAAGVRLTRRPGP